MREIAQKANVSHVTVSLALRNSPQISQETCKRIQQIAEDFGYKPDPILSALNSYRLEKHNNARLGTLAFIHNWPVEHFEKKDKIPSIYIGYYRGAVAQAEALGFKVEEFGIGENGIPEDELQGVLDSRNIQGALIAPLHGKQRQLSLCYERLSSVALGLSLKMGNVHHVAANQFEAVATCVRKLVETGHSRPAMYMAERQDDRTNNRFSGGFFSATKRLLGFIGPHFFTPDRDLNGSEAFLNWYRNERPDSLVVLERYPLRWLEAAGIVVGKGVSVVSPAGLSFRSIENEFTGDLKVLSDIAHVREDVMSIGAVAARVAIRMVHQNEIGLPETAQSILIEGEWVDGHSLRHL